MVGPFHLVGRLGAGSMGHEYLGRGPAGKAVAVKLVRQDLLTGNPSQARRRFVREAAAAQQVGAQFTAPLVAADLDAEPPRLATTYVPGFRWPTLSPGFGPLREGSLWPLVRGLAGALQDITA